MTLSTVGGWLACRGAGQLSTRYGKIEDMVVGLDVVLADGTAHPHRRQRPPGRRAPTSTSCSSAARARSASSPAPACALHPAPAHERRAAYGFAIVRRRPRRLPPHPAPRRDPGGAAPLRRGRGQPQLPDRRRWPSCSCSTRASRRWSTPPSSIVDEECEDGGCRLDVEPGRAVDEPPQRRLAARAADRRRARRRHDGGHRPLGRAARHLRGRPSPPSRPCRAPWPRRPTRATPTPTAPASTSRSPASPTRPTRTRYYRAAWDAGTRAVLARGGSLSHHHGVGLNRARFMAEALGAGSRRARRRSRRRSTRTASSTRASSACPARSDPTRSPSPSWTP